MDMGKEKKLSKKQSLMLCVAIALGLATVGVILYLVFSGPPETFSKIL